MGTALNVLGLHSRMRWSIFGMCKFILELSDRKQYVVYDKGKSDFADIKTEVPHGSVLSPLLFLVDPIY